MSWMFSIISKWLQQSQDDFYFDDLCHPISVESWKSVDSVQPSVEFSSSQCRLSFAECSCHTTQPRSSLTQYIPSAVKLRSNVAPVLPIQQEYANVALVLPSEHPMLSCVDPVVLSVDPVHSSGEPELPSIYPVLSSQCRPNPVWIQCWSIYVHPVSFSSDPVLPSIYPVLPSVDPIQCGSSVDTVLINICASSVLQ
jgi:hypothetical protein